MSRSHFSARTALAEVVGEQELETAVAGDLVVDLGLDSIALIGFVLKIESELGQPLSGQQIAALRDTPVVELDELVASWAMQRGLPGGSDRSDPEVGIVGADESPRPGVEPPPGAASPVTFRRFREPDRGEMAELCRRTCTHPWLRGMAHLLWLYQYLDHEPEACFVAETEGRVIAYWVGSSDEPALADRFREHVRRYQGEFVRLYAASLGKTLSPRRHFWFWRMIIGAAIRPRWAFRSYNRRDEIGPILSMTKVHFQVEQGRQSAGVVFELARAWLEYLATRGVDISCLPGFPGGEQNEAEAAKYWRRIGYHPVRFGDWTVLIAFVRSDASGI